MVGAVATIMTEKHLDERWKMEELFLNAVTPLMFQQLRTTHCEIEPSTTTQCSKIGSPLFLFLDVLIKQHLWLFDDKKTAVLKEIRELLLTDQEEEKPDFDFLTVDMLLEFLTEEIEPHNKLKISNEWQSRLKGKLLQLIHDEDVILSVEKRMHVV